MKSHYLELAYKDFNDAEGMASYTKDALSNPNLQMWERKEYISVIDNALEKKQIAQSRIDFINENY